MFKKVVSFILVAILLAGNFSLAVNAKSNTSAQIDLKSAINSTAFSLDYFVGSVLHTPDIARTNAAVTNMIKNNAGVFYSLSDSSVVDKNFMVPHSQQYYQPGVPGGICNKTAAMILLSYYRDGRGYTNLPDDATMYKEISDMYNLMTQYFSAFFSIKFLNEQLDTRYSYEMFGTFEMGVAYYLYSKGYKAAAQHVIGNISCSIMLLPQEAGNSILKVLMTYFSSWIDKQTNGELKLSTNVKTNANNVILNSIKQGEPVIIGCLTALGNDIYAAHYFVGVGYYKMNLFGLKNKMLSPLGKEYVEVYDTWGQNSSVVNWTVFKNTALFSSISIADV